MMTEVQKYLLKLIEEIDEICLKHNIDYYIFAGSMLGLERNEGFLPWDDDIDLIMTEDNYQKFIKVMRENPIPNRVFECRENNSEYPLQFGKYTSTDITGLIRPHAFGNASSGLWIDIIHAVPAPTSKRRVEFIKKWFSAYCELDNHIYVQFYNHHKGFYWRFRVCLLLKSIFGKDRIDKWAEKLFRNYSEEACTNYLMYHCLYTDYRFFDKKYFEKPVKRKFENTELSASPYNREFSRTLFGDSWMMVPPADNREIHTMILDFDLPYTKYVNDYMGIVDKEEALRVLEKSRELQHKDVTEKRKHFKRLQGLKGILMNEKIKAAVTEMGVDLKKEIEAGNHQAITPFYKEYEKLQRDSFKIYGRAFIRLDDELLYPFLKKLIAYDGEYYRANGLLNMREESVYEPLSEDLKRLKPVIQLCRRLSVALWDYEDMMEVEHILNTKIRGKYNDFCIDFKLADIYVKMHKAYTNDDYVQIKNDISEILAIIPDQGECIKVLGDIAYKSNNMEDAMNYYDKAQQIITNGLLLLDIKKKKEAYYNENM